CSLEVMMLLFLYFFFFFQAEDGIRDFHVTGVQTCALPISILSISSRSRSALETGSAASARSRSNADPTCPLAPRMAIIRWRNPAFAPGIDDTWTRASRRPIVPCDPGPHSP